jgi:hypothetical protein
MTLIYTNDQAEGAWPNGTRVVKTRSDSTDGHQDGAEGVIIGSIGPAKGRVFLEGMPIKYGYWVHWDDMKNIPVFVAESRLLKKD